MDCPVTGVFNVPCWLISDSMAADLVLDPHCDNDALMHLFLIPAHWPEARDLAAEFGCQPLLDD